MTSTPLFLTQKYKIEQLSSEYNIYDFQLRDHLLTTENLYLSDCKCYHTHNKRRCRIVTTPFCRKCKVSHTKWVDFKSLLFHRNVDKFRLAKCCTHIHEPPCGVCLSCNVYQADADSTPGCSIQYPFECVYTTDAICEKLHRSDGDKVRRKDSNKSIKKKQRLKDSSCPLSSPSTCFSTQPPPPSSLPSTSSSSSSSTSASASDLRFTTPLEDSDLLYEHVYNTRNPLFHMCRRHRHYHRAPFDAPETLRNVAKSTLCYVQTSKCCDDAVHITEFQSSFMITMTNDAKGELQKKKIVKVRKTINTKTKTKKKSNVYSQHIIYDPSLWRDQSKNHFISLLRAVINMPELVQERYQRFETSNFIVPSLQKYKSGKQSVVRTMITGFETKGIYQTTTMSCELPYTEVLIPQKLYDLMIEEYDMTYVALKRDPSIKQTCMFVCNAKRNPDPDIDVIVISDVIAKPLNQDQDGDKNGIYVLPLFVKGYDRRDSFIHKLAKFEMSMAFGVSLTAIATPRYSFSENNLLLMKRNARRLLEENDFFRKTYHKGVKYMLEVGSGYMHEEFKRFCDVLIEYNRHFNDFLITINDLAILTDTLESIVSSGAKGTKETLVLFINNIRTHHTLYDKKDEMIEQMNRYIMSSQELSHTGRKQFISQFAAHDLISMLGKIYMNKVLLADCQTFASIGTLMFNEPSLNAFIEELAEL